MEVDQPCSAVTQGLCNSCGVDTLLVYGLCREHLDDHFDWITYHINDLKEKLPTSDVLYIERMTQMERLMGEVAPAVATEKNLQRLTAEIISLKKQMRMVIQWMKLTMEKDKHK